MSLKRNKFAFLFCFRWRVNVRPEKKNAIEKHTIEVKETRKRHSFRFFYIFIYNNNQKEKRGTKKKNARCVLIFCYLFLMILYHRRQQYFAHSYFCCHCCFFKCICFSPFFIFLVFSIVDFFVPLWFICFFFLLKEQTSEREWEKIYGCVCVCVVWCRVLILW